MLGRPVAITNYATSTSQLENGVDGIVIPMDNQGGAKGIAELLKAPEQMQEFLKVCRQRDYLNSQETEKLYDFLR